MLSSCLRCPGFVPVGADACPHCGASTTEPERAEGVWGGTMAKLAKLGTAAGMMVTLMACYGGPIDDVFPTCSTDADCGPGARCDEFNQCVAVEICGNGEDDDFDGLIDADDDECADTDFETDCTNDFDDDEDGVVDCADPDCQGASACLEVCDNGIDDDADGFIDCTDVDSCSACPVTEIECGNLFDDDQDGLSDCDDPDCEAVCTPPVCGDGLVGTGEQCDDGNDVIGDGCTPDCTVEFDVVCAEATELMLGDNAGDNNGTTNVLSSTCVPAGGQEVGYTFTAAANGTLYLALQADHDMGIYVLSECDIDAVEFVCANAVLGGQLESTSVPLQAGQTVYVVADGTGPNSGGPFTLTATYVEE